jgi:hypothetical protein
MVVVYYLKGRNINGKEAAQFQQPVFNRAATVLKAFSRKSIFTAQKSAAFASRDAMLIESGIQR